MFLVKTRQVFIRPHITLISFKYNKRQSSSTTKLTSSYYHHVSSLPFVYKTISQNFDETAAKYPDHECFVFKSEQKRYTFKSLKDEVDNFAASLLELGFEKRDRIAVWLPNTSENVVTSFAASKLGLIKVNINPAYVGPELQYCINKVGCKGLVLPSSVKSIHSFELFHQLVPELDKHSTSKELQSKALPTLKHVILTGKQSTISGIHSYNDLIESGAKSSHDKLNQRQASVNPDTAAAIFYTSGTTGDPKAATLTNFGLVNLLHEQWKHFGHFFTRLCVPIPMFHVFAQVVGILNVTVAKCQVIIPNILPDTVSTMKAIQEEKCTALIGAPIIFRDILTHPDRKKYNLSSLEYSALGASPMHADFLSQLEKEIPITRVAQGFGLTECSAVLSSGMWAGDEDPKRRHGSLGRCMPGLEVKVADSEGNPVPIGQQGEMMARGYSIMAEYYNDREKTDETLTPSGWLRTGDEGTMDEDGFLYFVGRKKDFIIRGGVNIYPVEIEHTIITHPSVAEAQVFSIPHERYGEEVCAWIKLKPGAPLCNEKDIKVFLKDKVAFFKIPKHIRIVEKFIMTSSGKVQKFKLSEAMVNELKDAKKKV